MKSVRLPALPRQFLLGCERRGAFVPASDTYYKRYHAAYCGIIGLMPVAFDAPDDDRVDDDNRQPRSATSATAGAAGTRASMAEAAETDSASNADRASGNSASSVADAAASIVPTTHRSRRTLQEMADFFL